MQHVRAQWHHTRVSVLVSLGLIRAYNYLTMSICSCNTAWSRRLPQMLSLFRNVRLWHI